MIYDGFFDAVQTAEGYDRAYHAQPFTDYFANFIGSGVCVANNADSMLVSLANGAASVAPGYLFIRGYWLKNDAAYAIPLAAGSWAIVARLNTAERRIELTAVEPAERYADALCLALVETGGVQDTRYDADICGVIEASGALSDKVRYAVDYIDNEIEARLARAEQSVADAAAELRAAVASVEDEVKKLSPPPVGTVRYSAAAPDEKWLRCNGSYLAAADYPALFACLRNKTLGLRDGSITALADLPCGGVSNACVVSNCLIVFSLDARCLCKIPLNGGAPSAIAVSSASGQYAALVSPYTYPICLSMANGHLFVTQIRSSGASVLAARNFSASASAVELTEVFPEPPAVENGYPLYVLPYVQAAEIDGAATYAMCTGVRLWWNGGPTSHNYWTWHDGDAAPTESDVETVSSSGFNERTHLRACFNPKNGGEFVYAYGYGKSGTSAATYLAPALRSLLRGLYNTGTGQTTTSGGTRTPVPLGNDMIAPVVGSARALLNVTRLFSGGTMFLEVSTMTRTNPLVTTSEHTLASVFGTDNAPDGFSIQWDTAAYCQEAAVWVVFAGSGLLFVRDADITQNNTLCYFDTSSLFGTLSLSHLWYDSATTALYLTGQTTARRLRAFRIDLSGWTVGAAGLYLPNLSAGGIPAYIKALEG